MAHDAEHLDALIAAANDSSLSPQEHEQLHALIASDPEARRIWLEHRAMHADLRFLLEPQRAMAPRFDRAADAAPEDDEADSLRLVVAASKAARAERRKAALLARPKRNPLLLVRVWAFAAMLVLSIALLGILGYIARDVFFEPGAAGHEREPVAVMMEISHDAVIDYDASEAVAREWTLGKSLYTGFIHLERGRVSVLFNSGAEVTIEGPAKFGLNSPNRGILELGQITAYCPPLAKGFTVGAPGVAIVDLGTRFFMAVDLDRNTRLDVLEGLVALRRVDDTGNTLDEVELRNGAIRQFLRSDNRVVALADPDPANTIPPVLQTADNDHASSISDKFSPPHLKPGDTYHLLFVTRTTTDALSTDIGVYNDFVQKAADAAGIGSSVGVKWSAMVSTTTVAAKTNAPISAPVYNMNGEFLFSGYDDFWSHVIGPANAPGWDQYGNRLDDVPVWSGLKLQDEHDGDAQADPNRVLGDYEPADGVNTSVYGLPKRYRKVPAWWVAYWFGPSTDQGHLYALSEPLRVGPSGLAVPRPPKTITPVSDNPAPSRKQHEAVQTPQVSPKAPLQLDHRSNE